ncbi:hypothetical protein MUK42_26579, partial [Musa troglodytarum]
VIQAPRFGKHKLDARSVASIILGGGAGAQLFLSLGTADAVRQFTWVFEKHFDTGADITISCVPVGVSRASDYGLIKIDKACKIIQFSEKPKGGDLETMKDENTFFRLSHQDPKKYIASMGVYVFNRNTLLELPRWTYPKANDFGSDILPSVVKDYNVQIHDAIISHGCFLHECSIEHSVVGMHSRVDYGAELKHTLMMGADIYETEAEIASLLAEGKVPIGVGENTKIRNCIIDMNARIRKNVVIATRDVCTTNKSFV